MPKPSSLHRCPLCRKVMTWKKLVPHFEKHGQFKNPPTKAQVKAMKLAHSLAYRIWHHVKHQGYAIPVPERTPKMVKGYVQKILKANGIDWNLK